MPIRKDKAPRPIVMSSEGSTPSPRREQSSSSYCPCPTAQLKGAFFIFLAATAPVPVNQPSATGLGLFDSSLSSRKNDSIYSACTEVTHTLNKLTGEAYCYHAERNNTIPEDCCKKSKEECDEALERERQHLFDPNNLELSQKYAKSPAETEIAITKWRKTIEEKITNLFNKGILQSQHFSATKDMLNKLEKLMVVFLMSQSSEKLGAGQCGETAAKAFMKLSRERARLLIAYRKLFLNKIDQVFYPEIQQLFHLKIQHVTLKAKNKNARYKNHEFLLLDSDVEDCTVRSPLEVSKFLRKIKGIKCDPWMDDKLEDMSETENSFYINETEWETATIETLDNFDYNQIRDLPEPDKQIFCDEHIRMGLLSDNQECHEFINSGLRQRK